MSHEEQRRLMVTRQLQSRGVQDPGVLTAMGQVPRHSFVPEGHLASAYGDFPLPIGEGQTISQPYMVASMTEALRLTGRERVLEIGTGSGYQAAVLSELAEFVVTLERIAALADKSRQLLAELGYQNVQVLVGDGTQGFEEKAPYHGIIVTAGSPRVPKPLLQQLAIGGRLVIPVGNRHSQVIEVHKRVAEDDYLVTKDTACRFVDLIGEHGW